MTKGTYTRDFFILPTILFHNGECYVSIELAWLKWYIGIVFNGGRPMNRTTVNISDLSPKAQELYRKIMSGEYLMPEPFNSKARKKKAKIREKLEKEREEK